MEHFDLCYSYFYDPSKDKVNNEIAIYKEIKNTFEEILGKDLGKDEILSLYLIKDTIYKMANFTRMRIDLLKEK